MMLMKHPCREQVAARSWNQNSSDSLLVISRNHKDDTCLAPYLETIRRIPETIREISTLTSLARWFHLSTQCGVLFG